MPKTPLDNPAEKLGAIVSQLYELAGNSTIPSDQQQSLLLKAHDLRSDLVSLVAIQFTQETNAYTQVMADLGQTTNALNQAEANIQDIIGFVKNVDQLAQSIDSLLQESARKSSSANGPEVPSIPLPWASTQGSYPPRTGNDVQIYIDGQAAYSDISAAFHRAKEFIYVTFSFGDQDFLLIPENGETMFDILRARAKDGLTVQTVIWEPAASTPDTIPDPSPAKIAGVNDGINSVQARWDKANGYCGFYRSPRGAFEPFLLDFPPNLGCHHQKTYIMDDGQGGVVAYVGGVNPVQAYWDTPAHDILDARRIERGTDPLKGLEAVPPLHDIFYRISGPAVADVMANFIERYNGASIGHPDVTANAIVRRTAEQISPVPNGIEVQVLRTIAPGTYSETKGGDRGIRELYFNALQLAGQGSVVYIENQYFFDHGIVTEIHEAAERGAKIIALLESKPDAGSMLGTVESAMENILKYNDILPAVKGHANVALLTLGNCRSVPGTPVKLIYSEIYIHSKTMAIWGPDGCVMTGGSANIAFTSMWFHSEMNIAFSDAERIQSWVAQLWAEHLQIPVDDARQLMTKPDDAFALFKQKAANNLQAMANGLMPVGRVFPWDGIDFPPRKLDGINLT
jgi:phosphatidylserine/phosphatidylglycerophosphate/cardiolipin synthase-like enzyme